METSAPSGRLVRRGLSLFRRQLAHSPRSFAVGVAGAAVYALSIVGSSWALGRLVDHVVAPRFEDGEIGVGAVVAGVALVVLFGVLKAAGIVVRRVGATVTQQNVAAALGERVVERYHDVPLAWLRERPTGELLARATADPLSATEVLGPLPYATGVVALLVLSVGWLLVTDLVLAVVGLVLAPAFVALNGIYQARIEAPAAEAQAIVGRLSAVAHESFDGALIVKTLGAEGAERARFRAEAEQLRDTRIRVERLHATFESALDALPALAVLALVLLGSWRVERGAITVGTLVAFVSLMSLMTFPLRLIGYLLGDLSRSVVADDRIAEVLSVEPEPLPTDVRPLRAGPIDVRVRRLRFSHDGRSPSLRGVSFTAPAGSTVAVVGPTGSGKSTLLLLLTRLLPPPPGSVLLGGVDVNALDGDELAAEVALCQQETFLFGMSVDENVLLGRGPGDLVGEALVVARAAEFVHALPDGTRTVVGERGATLSGGQRQRIALARALAGRPRLLLLDEATSAVDPATESEILLGLRERLDGVTTILVASRPSTIAIADSVVFLDAGRVVASGTHADLLATCPAYEALVRAYERDQGAMGSA